MQNTNQDRIVEELRQLSETLERGFSAIQDDLQRLLVREGSGEER